MSTVEQSKEYIGYVKWFNNKTGFGFITYTDEDNKDQDIFVHHSGIEVKNEQYRYLVQGEYVQFIIGTSESSKYTIQAVNVTGINKGKLMCETRNMMRTNVDNEGKKGEFEVVKRRRRPPN